MKHYLIVVDYYSNFSEIELLENLSADEVISKLKKIFSIHGIPEEIVSD